MLYTVTVLKQGTPALFVNLISMTATNYVRNEDDIWRLIKGCTPLGLITASNKTLLTFLYEISFYDFYQTPFGLNVKFF